MYWSRDPDTGEKIFVYYRFLKDSVMVLDDSNEEEDMAEILPVSKSIIKRARKRNRTTPVTPLLTTATSSSPSIPPPRVKKQQEEQEEVDNLLKEVGFEPTALWLFSPRICLWKKNTTRHWKKRGRINCCVAFTKFKLWKKEPFE